MTHKCLDDLYSVQRCLRRQQWLTFSVDSLLFGGGTAWFILFLSCIRPVPAWVAAISGIGATVAALAWFSRKRAITRNDAGLYLDRSFGLKERMSAVAALDNTSSAFAGMLLNDAEERMRPLRGTPFLQSVIPPRASYLAIPVAAIIALLLLAPAVLPPRTINTAPVHGATPVADAPTAPADKAQADRLQQLLSRLRQANARLSRTNDPADRARVKHLQQELYRELSRLRLAGRTAEESPPPPGNQSARHGRAPRELRIRDTVQKARASARSTNTAKNAAATPQAPDSPDWAALPMIEAAVPASMHNGIRAYMNEITGITGL